MVPMVHRTVHRATARVAQRAKAKGAVGESLGDLSLLRLRGQPLQPRRLEHLRLELLLLEARRFPFLACLSEGLTNLMREAIR